MLEPNSSKPTELNFKHFGSEQMLLRSKSFLKSIENRRTIREFSSEHIPLGVIKNCICAAATAPSGANRQPYKFVVISDPAVKRSIRESAEKEERLFYKERAPKQWLQALKPFATNESKPFLETAPYLIAIFAEHYLIDENGEKVPNYYPTESTGLAAGTLINALHLSGLASLTHTPSPMHFLNDILGLEKRFRPFLLLVTGLPTKEATVPTLKKKSFSDYCQLL